MLRLSRFWRSTYAFDVLLTVGIVLLSLWLRWHNAQLIPRFTDEVEEIEFAYRIAQGGFYPMISSTPYIGPLHHYLMALGFWMGGGPTWPRTLSVVFSALTVGLTYGLAVSLVRTGHPDQPRLSVRLAGLIAASALAVSFAPVVVNGHLSWSNATTPFWTTLTLLIWAEAVRRDRPALLVGGGAVGGLALQTHPTALVMLVAAALWLVVTRPGWLRTRWPWLGLLAAMLAVSNLILYNLNSGFNSLAGAQQRDYAFTGGVDLATYLTHLRGHLRMGYEMVTSTFADTVTNSQRDAVVRTPQAITLGLTMLVALVYSWRRTTLPALSWIVTLAIFPYFNQAYGTHVLARYMAPLLPLTCVALGCLITYMVMTRRPQASGVRRRGSPQALALGVLAVALVGLALVYPVERLTTFYERELRRGSSNERIWQIYEELQRSRHTPILLDQDVALLKLGYAGNVSSGLGTLLTLRRVPHRSVDAETLEMAPAGAYVVLTDARRKELTDWLLLDPFQPRQGRAPANPDGYWLYRVTPRASRADG